jgi:hypothetical protein
VKFTVLIILALFVSLVHATPAYANVVWPALYLAGRMITWWAVSVGLVIEYLFLRQFIGFGIIRSVLAVVLMNAVSAVVGTIAIAFAGVLWEAFPGTPMYLLLGIGTFNPLTWTATFVMAVLINAYIERRVITHAFKYRFIRRGFLWLCAANSASVAVAAVSLNLYPVYNI